MRTAIWCLLAVAALAALFSMPAMLPAESGDSGGRTWSATTPVANEGEAPQPVERLGFLERRRLGLTIRNVRQVVEEKMESGQSRSR
jgi:hypothetical protein